MDWRDFASCTGQDSDIFFNAGREAEAETWCKDCPVKGFCEREAHFYHSVGHWGGTTYIDRQKNSIPHNPVSFQWH